MPYANILIQISMFTKSKNQEGQRLGRIQRYSDREHISYSLVCMSSEEERNATIRRDYATSEGYSTYIYNLENYRESEFDHVRTLDFGEDYKVDKRARKQERVAPKPQGSLQSILKKRMSKKPR